MKILSWLKASEFFIFKKPKQLQLNSYDQEKDNINAWISLTDVEIMS